MWAYFVHCPAMGIALQPPGLQSSSLRSGPGPPGCNGTKSLAAAGLIRWCCGDNCGRRWDMNGAEWRGFSCSVEGRAEHRRLSTRLPSKPGADLLAIPGVGNRNMKKLMDWGIMGVCDLKQLYKDKFFGMESEKMIDFLQSTIGIVHKDHASRITSFIKYSVHKDLQKLSQMWDTDPLQKERVTLCVEGNICVGKSTFLQRISNDTMELCDLVEVVPEPVSKWQDVEPGHYNILAAFYAEPQRYAYTFQNYVFLTRVMQERESAGGIKPLRLMERSVFSDIMVFARAVHEAHWMNEMETSIYESWFHPLVSYMPNLIPDGFIYLRASPFTCQRRLVLRKRAEELSVTLSYLADLHDKHENWLCPLQRQNYDMSAVRESIFYLEGDHVHPAIRKVPALILNCEVDIDFFKDAQAKQYYARQVKEFFELVKKNKRGSP